MYVCVCNAVTEREIRAVVQLGAKSLREVQATLGVASCCGKCASCARVVINDEKQGLTRLRATATVPV